MPPPSKSNMVTDQNPRSSHGGKETEEEDVPSHNLWVGNLALDTSDTDLMNSFGKYGALDCAAYASRNYAFVYFKHLDDAKAAKDALQGSVIRGNRIKIEFAKPAKPGKHLWVGGVSASVAKEQLEDEFLKYGKIEEFKFLRDRNAALIDYVRSEDALAALKSMNGKRLGGEQIRVDFLRSQHSRRDNFLDFHDSRDGPFSNRRGIGPQEPLWMPPDAMRNFPDSSQIGIKRHMPSQPLGGRRGGQPSNILWIGYPPSVQIDEQMLHNAMILFGEIERIKSFPARHYSFVEFRSVDEARRAKEGLQGRLFNDPRIQILFSSSEAAPGKDSPGFYPGIKGPRPDMLFNEPPFGPGPMDAFGNPRLMGPHNFPGPLPNGMPGPNVLMRPFGPQGGFDPLHSGSEFNDLSGLAHNFPDNNPTNPMGSNWRRLSPPAPGMWPPIRPSPGTWDAYDSNPFQRESKRSRIDGPPPVDDASFAVRKMDDQSIVGEPPFGFGPALANTPGQICHSPAGGRVPSGGPSGQVLGENDHCWRGIIAKGGTPVCNARCVPIGKGIDSQLPDVVNCSARTGLDMLTKHYAEASGFDIVYFLPDSEEDFASYTEFLRYLGAKNRAGVAKLDDGTTLFLVPPSEFLTKVLIVSGPERLYGVVLKLPQQIPSNASTSQIQQPTFPPSQYIDRQQLPPQTDYSSVHQDHQILSMDYNRGLHEDLMPQPPKQLLPSDDPHAVQSVPQDNASNPSLIPQGVSLTPELIATLAALLPNNNMQSSTSNHAQLPLGISSRPSLPALTPDKAMPTQGWRQDHQASVAGAHHSVKEEQAGYASQPLGPQFNSQGQLLSHFPAYTNASNGSDPSAQAVLGGTQIQDPSLNVPQGATSRPSNSFSIHSQAGQYTVPHQGTQQYQVDASQIAQKGYGMVPSTDASGLFRSQAFPHPRPPVISSPQVQGSNSQPQYGIPSTTDKGNSEFPNQVQQLQSALSSAGQGTSDGEADKNQRYQSTLQFAASLLLQIQQQQQQQQQQTAAQSLQGSGNHQ
ncbi:hypothetical protein NE237_014700 [Protea cynaroides]|uniref:RRM domain-containing protein n=1 Tax=Protea cynaroides TaxID=273540 RepID=A0A9Q0KCN3_9MAGN|nr:hypothetical protein NE237_014700 [Protea cynaroides]